MFRRSGKIQVTKFRRGRKMKRVPEHSPAERLHRPPVEGGCPELHLSVDRQHGAEDREGRGTNPSRDWII